MPPMPLVVLAVVGVVGLLASVVAVPIAIKLAEWYWDHQERSHSS